MTEIPKPPSPPAPTNVLGGGLIPKVPVPTYVEPPALVTNDMQPEESFSLYHWFLFGFGFIVGFIFTQFLK